jgi:hypothetical protein
MQPLTFTTFLFLMSGLATSAQTDTAITLLDA